MSHTDDSVSLALSAADIAWPLVLVMCVALMILPFVFLVAALRRPDGEELVHESPD